MRTVKHSEFLAEIKAQGVPRIHAAFNCPVCGTTQSAMSLIRAGAGKTYEDVEKMIGFSCVGRYTGAGQHTKGQPPGNGCNWTLGGFLPANDYEVETEDDKVHPLFAPSSPDEAKALMEQNRVLGTVDDRDVFKGDKLYRDMRGTGKPWGEPLVAMDMCIYQTEETITFENGDYHTPEKLVWMPSVRADIPAEIMAIALELSTQDNACTSEPLFAVQQRRRITGIDPDYADRFIWLENSEEVSEEEAVRLEAEYHRTHVVPDEYVRTGYMDKWEFVTGGLTKKGCEDYLAANGHNLREPRIYAYSGYRNAEHIALRNFLLSLTTRSAA